MSEQSIQRDPSGNILDTSGNLVGEGLKTKKSAYENAVDVVTKTKATAAQLRQEKQHSDDVKEMAFHSGGEGMDAQTGAVLAGSTVATEASNEADRAAHNAQDTLDYSLNSATNYYKGNSEAVQQHAIEDASASGHDVNFGGQHYPAQTPDRPQK